MKGKYSLSKKFYEDKKALESQFPVQLQVSVKNDLVNYKDISNWTERFLIYITQSKVPDRLNDGKGSWYDCNKYSESAMKEFKKIINSGIDYDMLVKSTILYYASGTSYKKKISNYIIDGDWRSDYMKLQDAIYNGEDALKDHIKKEIDDGSHNQWGH